MWSRHQNNCKVMSKNEHNKLERILNSCVFRITPLKKTNHNTQPTAKVLRQTKSSPQQLNLETDQWDS